ncbi:MAG: ATP-dependent RNA helicase, partial [Deltaproteobacteria bacterium]|nr:ATP-dependent RNA helicase [Deltaproteobacteria bacterium]
MTPPQHTLPIAAQRDAILGALASEKLVLTSPPGSGKSTLVPLWGLQIAPRVLVIEPRRVACRSLARYVAQQMGTPLGQQVGYAVRHDDRLSAETKVAFVTPGVALRMLEQRRVQDETLVVLDEFHERTLELDLLLAVLLARQHAHLAVLSATLEAQRVARHMGGQHLHVEGTLHPVELRHVGDDPLPHREHLAERVVAALGPLERLDGDALVFLPGKAEIAACADLLANSPYFAPLPLHAGLTSAEQDRAFEPSTRPRAILATNVAETSITLPGVRAVVDSGLVRRTTYREGRGALALMAISSASADQRMGRAGRLAPGVCLRLWHRSGKLEAHTPPEIWREDLSGLMLSALRLGHQPLRLPWLDRPRDFAFKEGERVLVDLGAARCEENDKLLLTETGKRLGALPVDAALGRLLVAATKERLLLGDMILLVASLGSRRPLFIRGEPRLPEDEGHDDPLTAARCDASARVLALRDPRRYGRRLRRDGLDEALQNARQLA